VSNLRTRSVPSLAEHPLPALVAAGVPCSVSTDDPAMFGTDLDREYQVVQQLGVSPEDCYLAGVKGSLWDETTSEMLATIGREQRWPSPGQRTPGGSA
jgi:aminodeoxyfutalosine deaminase